MKINGGTWQIYKKAAQDMWELSALEGGAWILKSEEAQERLGGRSVEMDLLMCRDRRCGMI